MAQRNFEDWIKKFTSNIAGYDYYINFKEVIKKIDLLKSKYSFELAGIDSLIGLSENEFDKRFINILKDYPKTLCLIPNLIAVHLTNLKRTPIECLENKVNAKYYFNAPNLSLDKYLYFVKKTGLADLYINSKIKSTDDYLTGVEVGINSNARKNRGGTLMEDLVEKYITAAGFIKNETYFVQMYASDVVKKFNVKLPDMLNKPGYKGKKGQKRFDFVIVGKTGTIYLIECNFYKSSGSKQQSIAGEYSNRAKVCKDYKDIKLVWITDGVWSKMSTTSLKNTFNDLEDLYCIADLEDGVLKNF